jgi:hypothetical protein
VPGDPGDRQGAGGAGPNGEHWTWGARSDRQGNRCILGAVAYARRKLGVKRDKTLNLILEAIFPDDLPVSTDFIADYNDAYDRTFDEIEAILLHARRLAGG